MRLMILAVVASGFAAAAQADVKFGTPPPSAHIHHMMQEVLGRAQAGIGEEISPGMKLTAATSQGDTIVFMTRAKDIASVERGMVRDPKLSLQQRFVKTFGKKFCRKGSGSRRFVDAGGAISIAAMSRSGELLAGGKLTKC
ncbi:hypothetical protein [Lentibacter sp. XHP0401]|jgi:hypothetical protein|uniref:hypothetical protein n=1 Tax=Lentibacter sp. XHP0401 TaxID=2984334 RepID=UPI0021E7D487|nr:hypothetical protein [Lentibacter sp. XHP0401]MCV2892992.1 hypothetical protein [Lentibacter sp. XHP0401]